MNATRRDEDLQRGVKPNATVPTRTQAENERMAPAVVHVDMDGARHIFRLRGWTWPTDTDPVFETGVRHALDTFDAFDIRATFFLIAEDLDDPGKAELVREIMRRGHEIASHSLTHAPLRGLPDAALEREVAGSRERIRQALGVEPAGFRAPFFSIDADAVRTIAAAGYRYDASMMPGRRVPGIDKVPDRPTILREALLELPLPAYRPLPFPFHPSYSLVLGTRYFDLGLSRFGRTGSPLVMLFHLIDFAEPLPASLLHGWRQRLFTLSHVDGRRKRAACARMLDRVCHSFTVMDTAELSDAARRNPEEMSS